MSYPRAGSSGDPRVASEVAGLLDHAARRGVPLWRLGPSLVLGFVRFFRDLPSQVPGIDKTQVPLLYVLLGSGTNPLKLSKEDAAYQSRPVGQQRCGNCSSAYKQVATGELICSQIQGDIEPNGWCRVWNVDRS